MRSRFTMDAMYHVYTQEQDLQDMAKVAVELWEGQLQSVEPALRKKKIAKMLDLATQVPHPQFAAFAQAIADTAQARSARKKTTQQRAGAPVPVPVPGVLLRETQMQQITRNLDLQGIILGGLRDNLERETSEDERVWLYAQTRLVARMKQAGLPQQCEALVAAFAKEGWGADVMKQCVDWLNVGALNALLAHIFAQLGVVWAEFAENEKNQLPAPKLTVAQAAELQPARVLLRVLGIAGLRELATVPPDSPLENALAHKLKEFATQLGVGIANHHTATQLHGLFDQYEKEGEKAFLNVPFAGVQKQAARMYCRVVAFVQKQERIWAAATQECVEAEAIARVDRKLAKHPNDAACLLGRARALSDYRNDTHGALAVLDGVPQGKRGADYARERAIILAKLRRLPEMLATLDAALEAPAWDDTPSLAKLFCLRAEARLHVKDALGAWSDARRATLIARTLPGLAELNDKVLTLLEENWEASLQEGLQEAPECQPFRFELAQARSALLHERWEEAARVGDSKKAKSAAAAAAAQQIAALAREMSKFFATAEAQPPDALPEGITPEMMAMLRQSGWDPQQGGLDTIAEGASDDEA